MTEVTDVLDRHQVDTKRSEWVLAAQPVERKRSAPRTRDSVGQARGKKSDEQATKPSLDPMASSSTSDSDSDSGYYMNPISWMLSILAKSAQMSNELTQAFTDNLMTLMTTVRDSAIYIGEQQKNELDAQAKQMKIGGIAKAVGAGVSIGSAAVSFGAGVYSKVKTNSLTNEIDVKSGSKVASEPESVIPSDDAGAGEDAEMNDLAPSPAAGAAGDAARGEPRVELREVSGDETAPEPANEDRKLNASEEWNKLRIETKKGSIERTFNTINTVASSIGQAGATGGQAVGDLMTISLVQQQGEAKKNQAEADGEKQIASSTMQVIDGALQKVGNVYDAEVRAAMEVEGTFAAAARN